MAASTTAYDQLVATLRPAATLTSISSLIGWDQETYMPEAAGAHRADQQALLAELTHQRRTNPKVGELIAAAEQDAAVKADPVLAASVKEMRRDYSLATKLPTDLVAELAKVGSQAQQVWKEARANNDFAAFAPWLERMMELSRRKADCYGVPAGGERYDALIDEYEPGVTAREIDAIFTPLRTRLSALIAKVTGSGKAPSDAPLLAKVDADRQHRFGLRVIEAMGFNLKAGRLDVTTHPFCSGMGPGDTRLTTRYRDEKFTDALYGTMHEAGHGLYDQGLPAERFGTPLGEAISLGIHESQSRMWENLVGRSREFWQWAYPLANDAFGGALGAFSIEDLYRAVNIVRPSYIRVEADEATYNLHVMLRFELERALIGGSLPVKDLPREWNSRFKNYLGIEVPDDRRGCLQDVHWSFGLIGYFPTYTLGNLYAAQFWETVNGQIPDLRARIAKGDFSALKQWLNTNIHRHGRRYRAAELCRVVTGKDLSADPLLRHLENKLGEVYGLAR